ASGSASEVGKVALWSGEIPECCFQNTLLRVRTSLVEPEYILGFLDAEARSGRLGAAARGVGIHHIGASRLSSWLVPVPPPPQHHKIVGDLKWAMSVIDALDADIESGRERSRQLRHAVLRDAFAGHLAEHDPSDEPASVLLERITAERPNGRSVRERKAPVP